MLRVSLRIGGRRFRRFRRRRLGRRISLRAFGLLHFGRRVGIAVFLGLARCLLLLLRLLGLLALLLLVALAVVQAQGFGRFLRALLVLL